MAVAKADQSSFAAGVSPVRNSPHKSASPTVEDIDENVSVLANRPKPATPYLQSSNEQPWELLRNNNLVTLAPNKASPVEQQQQFLEAAEFLSASQAQPFTKNSVKVRNVIVDNHSLQKPRMQLRRGKF